MTEKEHEASATSIYNLASLEGGEYIVLSRPLPCPTIFSNILAIRSNGTEIAVPVRSWDSIEQAQPTVVENEAAPYPISCFKARKRTRDRSLWDEDTSSIRFPKKREVVL